MDNIKLLIEKYWEKVKEHRIWLHQHPEPSLSEFETAAYIAKTLREIGLEPVEHIGGGCGVSAVIKGKGEGKCVALRADFDALEMNENTDLPFHSLNPGVMHACGHDSHAAMLLGVAYVLNDMRDKFNGCVKLIFQPAEEKPEDSGAKRMIEGGVLENPKVDAIFGQHVYPIHALGTAAIRDGVRNGSSDRFVITIRGRKSHGSEPQNGIDAVVIAANVITALQTIVSRSVGPKDSAVITIGSVHGGTRANIIADEVVLRGTSRAVDQKIRETFPPRIESIVKGIAEGMGGSYEFQYIWGYSPVVNTHDEYCLVKDVIGDVLGKENVVTPELPGLGGEDFSFYLQKVPGAFYDLGCRDMNKPFYPLHHDCFYPEWEALPEGIEILVTTALRYLSK